MTLICLTATFLYKLHSRACCTDIVIEFLPSFFFKFRHELYTLCLKKRKLWNSIAQNYNDRFWWHLVEIFRILQNRACMLQFSWGFALLSTFRLSNWTSQITRILKIKCHIACQVNIAPFSKEDKIWMKSLYECRPNGYNARQFITKFQVKGCRRTTSTGFWWSSESSEQCDAYYFRHFRWCNLGLILDK